MAEENKQKTISFKVGDEVPEKVKGLVDASGLTAKDWFQKAVALVEMQSVKEGATDYASDLSELEVHTTRIYELVSNMVQKSIYLKDKAVGDLETLLEQQREITADFQMKIKIATEEKDQALSDLEEAQKEQNDLVKQLDELREALETNKLLVSEYKEKNDTLNGLITKFEGYATENEQLKETLVSEQNTHQQKISDLTVQNNSQVAKINELEQRIDEQAKHYETALERLQERLEVEQEKALLKAEREHQKALSDANNAHTKRLQSMYDKIEEQRSAYEQKIAELERQLNTERTKNSKSK